MVENLLLKLLKKNKIISLKRHELYSCQKYFICTKFNEIKFFVQIPEDDKSNIATLINGILIGKLAVPTLTFSQALEFLFELGVEKLKKDYQAILKNFYFSSERAIFLKWR